MARKFELRDNGGQCPPDSRRDAGATWRYLVHSQVGVVGEVG